jgi:imidazolonepropionase-like amidohydrolase
LVPERFEVDGLWLGTARGPTVVEVVDGRIRPAVLPAPGPVVELTGELTLGRAQLLPRLHRTLMPGVIDHHVHLGLVERERLAGGPLVEVHDLGWDPDEVLAWRANPPHGVTLRVAGPFHTARGGYPSGRPWAPAAAVREVVDVADARAAVAGAAAAGVDAIKLALNSDMPLLSDELLRALVDAAHGAGLPAIVHAEGPGQAARAVAAGADTLVHTPWSERLSDEVLEAARSTTWISTLAIHEGEDRAVAIENLRRFHELGGRIRYGTDMGNGLTPVGPNRCEIAALAEAGLGIDQLIACMTDNSGTAGIDAERLLVAERPLPRSADELSGWLEDCTRLDGGGLAELF